MLVEGRILVRGYRKTFEKEERVRLKRPIKRGEFLKCSESSQF